MSFVCTACTGNGVCDGSTGDLICRDCGLVFSREYCFGDYSDPTESVVDTSKAPEKAPEKARIRIQDRYTTACSKVSTYFGLTKDERKDLFKRCAKLTSSAAATHKPINVALSILYTKNPSIFDEGSLAYFHTTKNSLYVISKKL